MAIRTVVTRGFGNGTFSGTIGLVALRGYLSAAAVVFDPQIYTANAYANMSPTANARANISPANGAAANPSPAEEAKSG